MTWSLCGIQEHLKAVKYEQSADSEYMTFTYRSTSIKYTTHGNVGRLIKTRAAAASVCTDVLPESISGVSRTAMWLI